MVCYVHSEVYAENSLLGVITNTLIYRCQHLSNPCFALLYLDHTEEDITSSLQCCKLYIFTWCHPRRMEFPIDKYCEILAS